jgi:hypothetical protein
MDMHVAEPTQEVDAPRGADGGAWSPTRVEADERTALPAGGVEVDAGARRGQHPGAPVKPGCFGRATS